jgi:hypothetical protein
MGVRASTLRKPLAKIKRHDKGYSCEDICCTQKKELHEGSFPYYKNDSL